MVPAALPNNTKYIANREGLKKALAKAKHFDRIARQTDAPPESQETPINSEVEDLDLDLDEAEDDKLTA